MGLFRKKINPHKSYNMSEVLNILSKPEYQGYTSVECGNGLYNIITIEKSKELESRIREREQSKNEFYSKYQATIDTTISFHNSMNYKNEKATNLNFAKEQKVI